MEKTAENGGFWDRFSRFLPQSLLWELHVGFSAEIERVEEIRLRAGRASSLTVGGRNILLSYRTDEEGLAGILSAFCGGSVYACLNTLRQGFLPVPGGGRLGVCGTAVPGGSGDGGVRRVTSLNLRIPHRIPGAAAAVGARWDALGRGCGILVYSPPGGGKTTLLRDLIVRISSGNGGMRTAVVDTRGELCPDTEGELVDVLCGYERREGMEIALRTLSPQVIVCDEIGPEDAGAIDRIHGAGIPLIASAHARTFREVACRPGIDRCVSMGVFGLSCGIRREGRRFETVVEGVPCCD